MDRKVTHYWKVGVRWQWESLGQKLSSLNLVMLASIILTSDAEEADRLGWLDAKGWRFTVNTAYRLARGWTEEDKWEGWDLV